MKLISIFLVLFFFGSNVTNEDLDKANGFEKFVFGTSPANYQNLTLEIDEGNTKLYSVDAIPQINGAQLHYVRLTFCRNQLSAISIATKNSSASQFLHYLLDNFGPPATVKGNSEWASKNVHLIYEPGNSKKDAVISYYSNVICNQSTKKN